MLSFLAFVAGYALGHWGWDYVVQLENKLFPKKEEKLPETQPETFGE